MTDDEHRTETASDFMAPGWWAACSCGWKGPVRRYHFEALADAGEHRTLERQKSEEQ